MHILIFVHLQVDTEHSYITVVNIKGWGNSMKDLDKFILRALFKCKLISFLFQLIEILVIFPCRVNFVEQTHNIFRVSEKKSVPNTM